MSFQTPPNQVTLSEDLKNVDEIEEPLMFDNVVEQESIGLEEGYNRVSMDGIIAYRDDVEIEERPSRHGLLNPVKVFLGPRMSAEIRKLFSQGPEGNWVYQENEAEYYKRQRWKKFWFYLLIVPSVILIVLLFLFFYSLNLDCDIDEIFPILCNMTIIFMCCFLPNIVMYQRARLRVFETTSRVTFDAMNQKLIVEITNHRSPLKSTKSELEFDEIYDFAVNLIFMNLVIRREDVEI